MFLRLELPAAFLTVPLARQRLLYPLLFTGLQVEGVSLDFLDNVFLLNFPFEAAQEVLNCLALLNLYFSQIPLHLPTVARLTRVEPAPEHHYHLMQGTDIIGT